MTWFSKTKPTDKDEDIFLSEFPIWAAIRSAELVGELQAEVKTGWSDILKNDEARSELIHCLIGAHLFYLSFTPEGQIIGQLFGENILLKSLSFLPERAKNFFALTNDLYERDRLKDEDTFLSSLEDFYKIKIDPLDAYVAFVAEQEVCGSEEFSNQIGELLPILNRLHVGLLEWMKKIVDRWATQNKK